MSANTYPLLNHVKSARVGNGGYFLSIIQLRVDGGNSKGKLAKTSLL